MIILLTSKAEWFWRTMRKADEQLYCISDCWVHWIINTRFSIENTFCIWHVWLFWVVFLATSSFNFVLMGSLCFLCEIFSQKSKSTQTGHRIDRTLFTSIYNTRTCIFTSFLCTDLWEETMLGLKPVSGLHCENVTFQWIAKSRQ